MLKKREGGPLRLGAGRLIPFSGSRRDKEGGPAAGAMTAAISGGWRAKREIFNQLLTTFLVIAMAFWLTVFWLCSKGYSRRALHGR